MSTRRRFVAGTGLLTALVVSSSALGSAAAEQGPGGPSFGEAMSYELSSPVRSLPAGRRQRLDDGA